MKKDIGVYIHIPFCKSKCYYCDFVSFSNKDKLIEEYINSVIEEIESIDFSRYNIETIYIGGGTPSILDSAYIGKILEKLKLYVVNNPEITIELNPGTVNKEKLEKYKSFGINRMSIGLQSTDDILLKQIGRIHTYGEFLEVYENARQLGFENINIDLMLGLPNQSLAVLEKSVRKVIDLIPEHISIYSLIIEENTKLYDMVSSEEVNLPEEEMERKMYWRIKELLEENGYMHYEISNFAKKGYKSRHNSDCWEQKEYIGIGASAHSYVENVRYSNTNNLKEYINNIKNKEFAKNIIIHERQSKEETEKEYMILGLRKIEGISIKKYKNKFGENPIFEYKHKLNKLIKNNLIEIDGDYIRLTNKGLDFANIVWSEFV